MQKKRLDVYLQYYLPHISGLTNTAVDINEYLQKQGNFEVNVYCYKQGSSNKNETINDIKIHRFTPWIKVGRASFNPLFVFQAFKSRKARNIVQIHAPLPEAALIMLISGKKCARNITYQCDSGITGLYSLLIAWLLDFSHMLAFKLADHIVYSSEDYYESSRIKKSINKSKLRIIPVPSRQRSKGLAIYKKQDKINIGFLGRFTSEKGIDILIEAMSLLPSNYHLLLAGPTKTVEKKSVHYVDLASRRDNISILGNLIDDEITNFYQSLDIFVLPSTNSFEAFGIVQIEALQFCVPVIVSDLPGVRSIVNKTQAGIVVTPKNPDALAKAILSVGEGFTFPENFQDILRTYYLNPAPLEKYLELLEK